MTRTEVATQANSDESSKSINYQPGRDTAQGERIFRKENAQNPPRCQKRKWLDCWKLTVGSRPYVRERTGDRKLENLLMYAVDHAQDGGSYTGQPYVHISNLVVALSKSWILCIAISFLKPISNAPVIDKFWLKVNFLVNTAKYCVS